MCLCHQAGFAILHWTPGLPATHASSLHSSFALEQCSTHGEENPSKQDGIICVGIHPPSTSTVKLGATLVPQGCPSRPGARSVLLKFEKQWDGSCNVAHTWWCTLWLYPVSSNTRDPNNVTQPTCFALHQHSAHGATLPQQPQALRASPPLLGSHLDAGADRAIALHRALRGETQRDVRC